MQTSDYAISKIKEFEGCKLYAYRDSKGVPTIGVGHTRGVYMGMAITQDQADRFLREDLKVCEQVIDKLGQNLSQGKYDALVSWLFNLGEGNFNKSTLKKKILANAPIKEIQAEFKRWVYCDGVKLKGLVRRRAWEADMWAK